MKEDSYRKIRKFKAQLVAKGFRQVDGIDLIFSSCHRQVESQKLFRDILDRLSIGDVNISDWRALMKRYRPLISASEVNSFQESLRIFSKNAEVFYFNMMKLSQLDYPVAILPSKHNFSEAAKADSKMAQGLEKKFI